MRRSYWIAVLVVLGFTFAGCPCDSEYISGPEETASVSPAE
ncbi:MAG TPA: hypothetical protein VD962_13325 [Rubricoccaceae bacterium]|nr:hypothetical protein [Rubricoccaceae bacterium]